MNTLLEHLLSGDPAVKRLTHKYLLDRETPFVTQGWIDAFLERFDLLTDRWGQGIYGPKWVSTFYTMRDLAALEIDPLHPIFQRGLNTLLTRLMDPKQAAGHDLCVIAMFTSLLAYGQREVSLILPMLTCLMEHRQPDGGWNCAADHHKTNKSSIHTTLCVLEAFADCEAYGACSLHDETGSAAESGREYLLRKKLFRRESDQSVILPYITQFHFPPRWKYDVLRALLYFASVRYPFDPRMGEALELLKAQFKRGYLLRGSSYSGLLHFKMETGKIGNMNTLRGLRVLKQYEPELFEKLLHQPLRLP